MQKANNNPHHIIWDCSFHKTMNLGPVFNWKSPLSTQCFSGFFSHTQKNNNVKETFFDKKPLKNKDIEDEYFLGKYYKIKVFFHLKLCLQVQVLCLQIIWFFINMHTFIWIIKFNNSRKKSLWKSDLALKSEYSCKTQYTLLSWLKKSN